MEKKVKAYWKIIKSFLLPFIVAVCAVLLFWSLYRYDNKYTTPGTQPINGILNLTQKELEERPIHYLIYDWEFYPDELLTSDEISRNSAVLYHRYISIGMYSNMKMGSVGRKAYGCGTYRLILSLPDTEQTYTLDIPELYSAARVYIGDQLYYQAGNPDLENYRVGIKNSLISFRGKGYVPVTIAVSNQTGFYSGMVYPIGLGLEQNVYKLHDIRFLMRALALLNAVLVAVLSFFLFLRSKNVINFLYVMLAFVLVGYTTYPVISNLFESALQPWSGIEIFSNYLMMSMVVLLYAKLLNQMQKWVGAVVAFLAVGAVIMGILDLGISAVNNYEILNLISAYGTFSKWFSAAAMFEILFQSYRREEHSLHLLSLGAVFYLIALVSDRAMPLYEPVIGGWFHEIGGFVLIFCLHIELWKKMLDAYKFQLTYATHTRNIEKLQEIQRVSYEQLKKKIEETRKARHDFRQHMRILADFAAKGELECVKQYLATYSEFIADQQTSLLFCENHIVNSLISYYRDRAQAYGIAFEFEGMIPDKTQMLDVELGTLFGNLLENAIDASRQDKDQKKWVKVNVDIIDQKIVVQIRNSFHGKSKIRDGHFYSTKHEGLGIGTDAARATVEKYGGMIQFMEDGEQFVVKFFLPWKAAF